MVVKRLTELEAELIEAVRNFKRAYPNGKDELEWYCQKLFDELMDLNE